MKIFKTLALSLAITATVSAQAEVDRTGWPKSFTIGTASQGGTFFVYGSGWAGLIANELGITGAAEVTGGPTQNLALVHTGEMAFGLTTLGPAAEAIKGDSPLAPGMPMDNVCAMFPMYETPFSIVTLASSGIDSISKIPANAKIGFGPAASTADVYFPAMLEKLGAKFERRNGSWSDLSGQLQDGMIDMIGFAVGVPVPAVTQLEVQTKINILTLSDEELQTITDNFPVSAFTIPANTYKTLNEDAKAVSMWNFAIAACDLPESLVYEATRVTMENNERMIAIHNSAKTSIPENVSKNNALPFHPGAARWFTENGYAISPELIYKK
ncbi:TAXI family TRAP transporter solute-binding subunit [Suttonella indologenes]|uniref:TRAP transporter solute receptor, TAXI family n=1 Tax=Suttonella indologenes TaxID=13276 RepID=A0A380N0E9_9GAMM|nr:TAXI family TRAP transporter solute-binding subunit [Suttonella indologenes]SUO98280.1 TRAP transporter solute receptor, TAXI family [Suttonella indologenes]